MDEKVLNLLTSIAQSIEEVRSDVKNLDFKVNDMNNHIVDVRTHFDARFDLLSESIKNINSRELHMMDMILENRRMA